MVEIAMANLLSLKNATHRNAQVYIVDNVLLTNMQNSVGRIKIYLQPVTA